MKWSQIDCPYVSEQEFFEQCMLYVDLRLTEFAVEEKLYTQTALEQQAWYVTQIQERAQKKNALQWKKHIRQRRELNELAGIYWEIDRLKAIFQLDCCMEWILLFSGFCRMTHKYDTFLQKTGGDTGRPEFSVCVKLFQDTPRSELEQYDYERQQQQILQVLYPASTKELFTNRQMLFCDDRLLDMLTGNQELWNRGVCQYMVQELNGYVWYAEEELQRMHRFDKDQCPVFVIKGEKGRGKRQLVYQFCRQKNCGVTVLDVEKLFEEAYDKSQIELGFYCAKRECLLEQTALLINAQCLKETKDIHHLLQFVRREQFGEYLFVLLKEDALVQQQEDLYPITFESLSASQRIHVWNHVLRHYHLEDIDISLLSNTFALTPGQMELAAACGAAGEERLNKKNLYRECYRLLRHALGEKASKIDSGFQWEDLKLSKKNLDILHEVCSSVRYRNVVIEEWNFKSKVPYGAGTTVVFAGPPGTGKTMAAHVIANELGMELYRVDMSQVLDKYVGETEKNLKQIFVQAEKSNSILFFDEADAVFNKRMEATGANERYANIESAMLLQYMEEYKGISILATNNISFIDVAFLRRIKYYIRFTEPDAQARYEMWCHVFPKEAPLEDSIDFHELAEEFEITGAIIKNVAVYAAYLAAEQEKSIGVQEIIRAMMRELEKNSGVNLMKEKLGKFAYSYDVTENQ